jgi:hypothetical protein
LYGDNQLEVNAQDYLKIHAFGNSEVMLEGRGSIHKGLLFGENEVVRSW